MTYTSTRIGEHPPGLHWTEGESRDLSPEQAASAPAWLVPTVEAPLPIADVAEAPESPATPGGKG